MRTEDLPSDQRAPSAACTDQLSKWVNERFPPWEQLLSARDVARLTCRRRWVLSGLMPLGLFPKRLQYQGRPIGWNREDVLDWLSRGMQRAAPRPCRSRVVAAPCSKRSARRGSHDVRKRRRH